MDTAKQVIQLLELENQRLHQRLKAQTHELAALRGRDANEQLELEITRLGEQLAAMRQQLFGAKSERRPRSADKDKDRGDTAQQAAGAPARRRRGHGRTAQPMLPLVEQPAITLDDDERSCTKCQGTLDEWDGQFETSEQVTVVERKFVIEKIKRQKYRCRCQGNVVCAPAPLKLIPGGRYSLEFIANVVVDKYLDNIPLNRQVTRMRRDGLMVTSQALCDQTVGVANLLTYCADALNDRALLSRVVHIDETTWRLMLKGGSKRWYLWCVTGNDAAYYRLAPSRATEVALELLESYRGVVVADGYQVYKSLAGRPSTPFELVFCWAHVRRKLITAEKAYPHCAEAIELIRTLYAIEREVPKLPDDADEAARELARQQRARLRTGKSQPIVDQLYAWALAQRGLPGSSLRKATDYMVGLWDGLKAFVTSSRVNMPGGDYTLAASSVRRVKCRSGGPERACQRGGPRWLGDSGQGAVCWHRRNEPDSLAWRAGGCMLPAAHS